MSDFVFEYRVRVTDIDLMGVMHHQQYPRIFEWCREELFRHMGQSYHDHIEQDEYLAALAVSYRMTVHARYDQILQVVPRFTKVTKARVTLSYEVFEKAGGQQLATGTTEHAILNGKGKVVRVPNAFLEMVDPK